MSIFQAAALKIINFLGMTTLGQKTKANSLSVSLASDEDAVKVTDNSGSLTVDSPGIPTTIGQKAKAAALGVTLASDEDLLSKLPSSLGQKAKAAALGVTLASDEDLLSKLPSSLGQKDMAGSMSVAIASDQTVQINAEDYIQVCKLSFATVGVSTHAYVAGDVVGAKLLLGAVTPSDGGTILKSVVIINKSSTAHPLQILIFDANPSSTIFTDGSTLNVDLADLPKIVGKIKITAEDYILTTAQGFACKEVEQPIISATPDDLYAVIVADGTFTPVVSLPLAVTFHFQFSGTAFVA